MWQVRMVLFSLNRCARGLFKRIFVLLWILQEISSCALPDGYTPAWSISGRYGSKNLVKRAAATLQDRMDCQFGATQPATRTNTLERVNQLIDLLKRENIDAYIVPTSDPHQSEYVSDYDKRRDYITGFTGSAGVAVILADGRRALWTDGRYYLQADMQLDCEWILMKEEVADTPTIPEWLKEVLQSGMSVGADASLISFKEWEQFQEELQEANITMEAIAKNLVDEVWPTAERPPKNTDLLEILELKFAGKSWQDKVAELRQEMTNLGVDLYVITALDEVAWLFNMRGQDIPYNPVFRSYAIIDRNKIRLFIDANRQRQTQVDLHLMLSPCDNNCIELHNYDSTLNTLQGLASMQEVKKVLLPSKYAYSGGASYAIYSSVPEEKRFAEVSPALMIKARKNPTEIQGMRNSHLKDSVALIDFLSFLQEEMDEEREWDEIRAQNKLTEYRAEQEDYKGLSFEAISAYGSNAAVIHYRPTTETNKVIGKDSLYLLDSGGQYKDGTTDVTRTMHYGTPSPKHIDAYTRVLMGAVDVANLIFPKGTKDTRVDVMARRHLFKVGLNYNHGTGHGIGMFLNIHESPIQMRIYAQEEHTLEAGHFFSDEPGYYKNGDFGIRLETILMIAEANTKHTPDVPMLGFEAVTLVPFEPNLIDYSLLNKEQCEYLNAYNERIRKEVIPALQQQGRSRAEKWVNERINPLTCNQAVSD